MSKKKEERFLKIPHWYWDTGLPPIDIILISSIASWQRDKKEFFESKEQMALKFNCSTKTIQRSIKSLVNKGLIKETGKKGRVVKYEIIQSALEKLKHCGQIVQHSPGYRTNSPIIVDKKSSYKNTKNINKNILRVEEEVKASSSPKAREIHPTAFHKFAQDLDI